MTDAADQCPNMARQTFTVDGWATPAPLCTKHLVELMRERPSGFTVRHLRAAVPCEVCCD